MEWIEVSARTLDDARELALDRLGVVVDELEYEVIDEPRGGLFGLGRTDARIRARVKPLSREKPPDRRRRRSNERRPSNSSRKPRGEGSSSRGGEQRVSLAVAGLRRQARGKGGRTVGREVGRLAGSGGGNSLAVIALSAPRRPRTRFGRRRRCGECGYDRREAHKLGPW